MPNCVELIRSCVYYVNVLFLVLLEIKETIMSHCVHTTGLWAGCAGFTDSPVIRVTAVRPAITGLAYSIMWTLSAVRHHLITYSMEGARRKCFHQSWPAYNITTHTKLKHWVLPVQDINSTHLYYLEKNS